MKFSIITATYNRKKTIFRAINSLKNQSHKNIELIVIDGVSNDGSIDIIDKLIDVDDVFISEPDKGIYDALNKGLKNSTGDIIGFLHSDDMYPNNNVIRDINYLFSLHEADIVYGDASFFAEGKQEKVKRIYKSGNFSLRRLAWGWMPAHTSMFLHRRVFEKHGNFKNNFKIAADYDFMCRIASDSNLRIIYHPEIFMKMQLGGISTKGFKNTILLNKEVLRACRENNIYSNILMLLSKYPMKAMEFLSK